MLFFFSIFSDIKIAVTKLNGSPARDEFQTCPAKREYTKTEMNINLIIKLQCGNPFAAFKKYTANTITTIIPKYKKISVLSAILTGTYLILCVSIILFIFPSFFTTNEIMPLYSAARYISFGNFLQRLESIFMMVWILSFISYLTIATKFAISIFQKMTNIKNTKEIINVFGLLTIAISMFPKNLAVSTFWETKIYSYFSIAIIFIFGISILILANIKKRKNL